VATVGILPTTEQSTAPAVRTCYELLSVAPLCGVTDLTDGKYLDDRNDRAAYLAAQQRQADYLLDQARCRSGSRLLDIGCGYGRILEQAARRGANAIGITVSPSQVVADRARGLDVRELNYRHIFANNVGWAPPTNTKQTGSPSAGDPDPTWEHAFDAVTANGSLEHFVQPADAAAGRADEIYSEMFEICHRLLTRGGRFVTTAIHFREPGQFDANEIVRGPSTLPTGSDAHQFAMLAVWFGGWYPEPGQLVRCARPYFDLAEEEDGTHDYHLTSEYWLNQFKRSLVSDPRVWWSVARQFWQRPRPTWEMLRLQLWDQSWVWQFRPPAPMRLLRQTWARK
jgi:cyclopropane fatty-acyl-phospholipid synthase-like methyltransferase